MISKISQILLLMLMVLSCTHHSEREPVRDLHKIDFRNQSEHYLYATGKLADLHKLSTQSLLNAARQRDSLRMAISHHWLGRVYSRRNSLDTAFIHYNNAEKLYQTSGSESNMAVIYLDMAAIQFKIKDYTNCEKNVFEALPFLKKTSDLQGEFRAYTLLACVYKALHEFKKALHYQGTVHQLIKYNPKFKSLESDCLSRIGAIYNDMGAYGKALEFYEKAHDCSHFFNPFIIIKIGDCNMALGNSAMALKYYQSLLDLSENLTPREKSSLFLSLADYYREADHRTSYNYATKAYHLAKSNDMPREILAASRILIDNKNADPLEVSQNYIRVNDSLKLAERKMRNSIASISYDFEEATEGKSDAVKQKWLIFAVAIAMILAVTLLLSIKIQKIRQRELRLVHAQQKSNEEVYKLINEGQIKLSQGRKKEKRKIADELTGGVLNKLSGIRRNLLRLESSADELTIKKSLVDVDSIQDVEREIREVAHLLSNEMFSENKSYNTLLEMLFDKFRTGKTQIFSEIEPNINWETTGAELKMHTYRITEDLLHNCTSAKARHVFITLLKEDNVLKLVINDDGGAISDDNYYRNFRLKNILSRVNLLSGIIDIRVRKGKGATIIVNLPITKPTYPQHGKEDKHHHC